MKKELRRQQVIKRKNFLPTLILTLILWLLLAIIIYFVDPHTPIVTPIFFALVLISLLFTFSLLLGSRRRGLITSVAVTLFLVLRYFGVGNILNLILIAGLGVTIELYLARK